MNTSARGWVDTQHPPSLPRSLPGERPYGSLSRREAAFTLRQVLSLSEVTDKPLIWRGFSFAETSRRFPKVGRVNFHKKATGKLTGKLGRLLFLTSLATPSAPEEGVGRGTVVRKSPVSLGFPGLWASSPNSSIWRTHSYVGIISDVNVCGPYLIRNKGPFKRRAAPPRLAQPRLLRVAGHTRAGLLSPYLVAAAGAGSSCAGLSVVRPGSPRTSQPHGPGWCGSPLPSTATPLTRS